MVRENNNLNWTEIINKLSSYEDSIVNFCKENSIKPYQLYHQRKKLRKPKTQTFHAIDISNAAPNEKQKVNLQHITIEIGNAKIYAPVDDKTSLLNIVRELAKSC
ncbi:MAG TPA: hypothetical protein VIK78_00040 [Ruminiclostridium sp.]